MNEHRSRPTALFRLLAAICLVLPLADAYVAAAGEDEISDAMKAQIALDRVNFSPGAIDGRWGDNTRGALRAFQRARGLEATGELDQATREALGLDRAELIVDYAVTEEDVAGPFVDEIPDDMMARAELERLAYTSAAEALAEKFHLSEDALRSLNPGADFEAGATIRVPAVLDAPEAASEGEGADGEPAGALRVVVSKSAASLEVRDAADEVVFYAPVTSGSRKDPLPIGEWKVRAIATEPRYHYDPELFRDADPDDSEASLPPGPNNPVGVVWIDLDKEHYGIHGTPEPTEIGYDVSEGCVRLTNWDAEKVARLVSAGSEVIFEE